LGHRYYLKRKITSDIREICCRRCKREFVMHDETKTLIPLDEELSELGDNLIKEYDKCY